MIDELPPVVQRWLKRSNIVGKETIQIAHQKQSGEMKTRPEGSWMSVDAEQYTVTNHYSSAKKNYKEFEGIRVRVPIILSVSRVFAFDSYF